jgi:hypothetical protein
MKKIFNISINGCLYSKKALEGASTICTSCMSLVKYISLKMALEKEIPFIGYGWSPRQAPVQSSVMKTSSAFIKATQKVIYEPLHKKIGDEFKPSKDTDPNSTNCLMNAFANQIHQDQFGFHPYAFEIAGLVRMGVLSREEGLKRLNEPGNRQIIMEVKQKLEINS